MTDDIEFMDIDSYEPELYTVGDNTSNPNPVTNIYPSLIQHYPLDLQYQTPLEASSDLPVDLYTSGDFWRKGDNIGTQPSAPLDIAKLDIRVEWTAPFPERWRALLQKALQSWLNLTRFDCVKEEYNIIKLQLTYDHNHAEVVITPSKALDVLKQMKTATLTFKELNQSAVVHFLLGDTEPDSLKPELPEDKKKLDMPEVDMIVISLDRWPKEVQTELLKRMGKYQAGNKLSFQGSLAEVERFYREVCEIVGGPEAGMDTGAVKNDSGTSGAPPAFFTPLHHYWYFSHAYKKEINQIQDKFGVKIDAEVSVSVTAEDQTRPDSVKRASDELTDLYQTSTTSLQSLPIPQTQLDSKIVKDLVHNIQSDQAKMALMISADCCVLSGPKNTISGVQSRLNSEGSGEVASRQKSGTSKLSFDPILMSDTRWRLMKKRFEKQLLDIEQKYGVQFCDEHSHDSTKVTIQSRGHQPVNQESHALRAFMQLYLEVVLSAVSVSDQERTVVKALERHPKTAETKSMVREPWFDEVLKTQIKTRYLLTPKQRAPTATRPRAKSSPKTVEKTRDDLRQVVSVNSEQKDSDKSKYDNDCPICMDTFTDQVKLKCGHGFCRDCLGLSVKSLGEMCPVCKKIYGKVKGNQPRGTMSYSTHRHDLPGYYGCGTIEIYYNIPGGKQTDEHPNPGQFYYGAQRRAFLPNNAEGKEVLQLLMRAFDQRLIFTVGTSTTTGAQNTVTWNDIHHKTNMTGGPQNYGYPDPDYLKSVKEDLKAKGIE